MKHRGSEGLGMIYLLEGSEGRGDLRNDIESLSLQEVGVNVREFGVEVSAGGKCRTLAGTAAH